jgi:hypothetical protein
MSISRPIPLRWMNWRAPNQIIGDSAENDPTKPSKPGFVGFVGSVPDDQTNIRVKSESVHEAVNDTDRGIPWAEWKAAALNQLFKEQGLIGQPGRITAATIRHGESVRDRVDCGPKDEQPMSRAEAAE